MPLRCIEGHPGVLSGWFGLAILTVAMASLPARADVVRPDNRPPPASAWQPPAVAEIIRKNGHACDVVTQVIVQRASTERPKTVEEAWRGGASPRDRYGYETRTAICDNGKRFDVSISGDKDWPARVRPLPDGRWGIGVDFSAVIPTEGLPPHRIVHRARVTTQRGRPCG
jgi:hypothetical protein